MSTEALSLLLPREALVVFEDRGDAPLLRWLRPGFRHCYCLTGGGRHWMLLDPLKSRLAVAIIDGPTAGWLATHFHSSQGRVLHGFVNSRLSQRLDLRPLTCVELVKRVLGLSAPAVLTPYQLYRRLLRPEGSRAAFIEMR